MWLGFLSKGYIMDKPFSLTIKQTADGVQLNTPVTKEFNNGFELWEWWQTFQPNVKKGKRDRKKYKKK